MRATATVCAVCTFVINEQLILIMYYFYYGDCAGLSFNFRRIKEQTSVPVALAQVLVRDIVHCPKMAHK
jgi:hypothetical protein